MTSIFTKIIRGEIPCYKIGETEECFAFLDIHPLKKGHTLVVPKTEVDRLFDLDEESYQRLFQYCRKVAKAIKKAFPCDRIGMAVIGLEVPHAHVHLMPIDHMGDLNFANPKLPLTKDAFEEVAQKIRKELEDL